ncbi:MAG: agmatine deiminase family protein [Burkholderiales bacterium]|nr:agmatine deiminase family protein [Burkholderiales bacterium]
MLRRKFLQTSSSMALGTLLAACGGGNADATPGEAPETLLASQGKSPADNWRMPDEAEPHLATWMAFGARRSIWGSDLLRPVQDALARIANTIVDFEPVNMLVGSQDLALARSKLSAQVNLIVADVDDLWMRDTGPVFVKNSKGEQAGVNFNFNGWGNKQSHSKDAGVASKVTQQVHRQMLRSSLVLEGGGIEVDGQGTAIITESCVLNANRNPNVSKAACEAELRRLLGIRKVIWLPGIKGKDITDAHTDFYARFTSPGVVVVGLESDPYSYDYAVTRQHLDILRKARDANGRALKVMVMDAPGRVRPRYSTKEFAAGYVNFYVLNGAVLMPEFGDLETDGLAKETLENACPQREIIALNIDAIAAGGGGIHCTTQQQ